MLQMVVGAAASIRGTYSPADIDSATHIMRLRMNQAWNGLHGWAAWVAI